MQAAHHLEVAAVVAVRMQQWRLQQQAWVHSCNYCCSDSFVVVAVVVAVVVGVVVAVVIGVEAA